ncbi:MAG: hypothetical protein QXV17_02845 [Candidatus Micrarchaeaceae archaeon]
MSGRLASRVTLVDVKLDSSPKKVDLPFPAHVVYLYSYTDIDPSRVYIAKDINEKPVKPSSIPIISYGESQTELYIYFDSGAITGSNPTITLLVMYNARPLVTGLRVALYDITPYNAGVYA